MANREDPKGERGGDTGPTKQEGKGPQAEKGDQRRDKRAVSRRQISCSRRSTW